MKCVCFQGHARWWGMQGREVGSFTSTDELAGICKRWITRQRESIIQGRKKKRNMDPLLVAPGSPFQFKEWFSQNVEGKRSSLEGVREGWWGVEKKRMNETTVYMHVPHRTLLTSSPPYFPHPPSQIHKAKHSVKMQKAIIRPAECTDATYDGWVWDLERSPVKHRPFPLLNWPSLFPHLSFVSKTYQAPGWNRPKCNEFVIHWSGCTLILLCPLLFFCHLISNLSQPGEGKMECILWNVWEQQERC